MQPLNCRVIGNNVLQSGIRELLLALAPGAPSFSAGQYLMLDVGGAAFPFSIANAPNQKTLALHIKPTPNSSDSDRIQRFLDSKPVSASIQYPLGDCCLKRLPDRPIILIAAATGITQMKSMLDWLIEQGFAHPIHLYWGVLTPEELYLREELETAAAQHQVVYTPVVSQDIDHWEGRTGLVGEVVLADISNLNAFQVYVSGSPAMVYGTLDHFVENGFQPENMHSDVFSYAPRS